MALSRRIALRGRVKAPLQAPRKERGRAVAPAFPLSLRLHDLLRALRSPNRRLAACEAVLRALSLSHSPEAVAARLVDLAFDWLEGQGWAVLSMDDGRGLSWLYDRGVTSTRRPAVTALATRAVEARQPTWCEDLARLAPTRLRGCFGALALPLCSDGRVVGVLVGIETAAGPAADLQADVTAGDGKAEKDAAASRPLEGQVRDDELAALSLLVDPMTGALDAALRVARAQRLSSIDDLTGLYNTRALSAALQRETKRALRTHRPLSILFVDLDGFKGINDRWGHLSGSRALVEAADRIASGARETDIVSRYGGDEFAIVLPDTPAEGAMIVAHRVRELIASKVFLEAEGIGYRLTASVGAATLPEAARTPESLLAAADAAMYRVKARGKDGIEQARDGNA